MHVQPLGQIYEHDPFKKIVKNSTTNGYGIKKFEDVLQEGNNYCTNTPALKPRKKPAPKTSQAPTPQLKLQQRLKSILKSSNSNLLQRGRKKVKWGPDEEKEFEIDNDDAIDIITKVFSFEGDEDEILDRRVCSEYQRSPLHKVVNNILMWDVDWLEEKNIEPPVNGYGKLITPMLQKYESYASYQQTIVPLMMYELWASVCSDYKQQSNRSFEAQITYSNEEQRGLSQRKIFFCQGQLSIFSLLFLPSHNNKSHCIYFEFFLQLLEDLPQHLK